MQSLRLGGVIAYPTEAVWGLGCDPADEAAVVRILRIKQRAVDKGLILVAADYDQIAPIYEPLTPALKQVLQASWPGPHTWLIPDPENLVPFWIKGRHDSVAVRLSAHPLVRELCKAFGGPLVSTSANRSGKPEIRSRLRLLQELGDKLDYVVAGNLGKAGRPSTITDLLTGQSVR